MYKEISPPPPKLNNPPLSSQSLRKNCTSSQRTLSRIATAVAVLFCAVGFAACTAPDIDIGASYPSTLSIVNCPGGDPITNIVIVDDPIGQHGMAYGEHDIYARGINSVTLIDDTTDIDFPFNKSGRFMVTAKQSDIQYYWLGVKFTDGGAVVDWNGKTKH
ncbi:MAG: hypothetical protein LBQ77_03000 [Treponema sp.]|nr:hypothetical protein [Treponema sp.]